MRPGKQTAVDVTLAQRLGTSREQIQHMREEGGAFTFANGFRVLFVSPYTLQKPAGYDAFVRWLKRA